jgi:dienelactone hydrolase
MRRVVLFVSGASLVLLLGVLLRLSALESGGPIHWDLTLGDGTPATMYLPAGPPGAGAKAPRRRRFEPPPEGARPAAVVLVHGFASDRRNMSPLARSLAMAGYGVLAVDVAGHGENRRLGGIRAGRSGKSGFYDELEAAVDFLRRSPFVDGERVVMMGHSMGAGATLGYGTWDPTLDGLVMIAGGWRGSGPHRPPNALFLYAEGDSLRLHEIVKQQVAQLAGRDLPDGETAGDFARGTAVQHRMVAGAGHADVVFSDAATRAIVEWTDGITGVSRKLPVGIDDPRLFWAGTAGALVLFVLPGLGFVVGRLAPGAPPGGIAGLVEFGVFCGALVASLPLIAGGSPLPALSIEVADLAAPYLAVAGGATLAVLTGLGRAEGFSVFHGAGRAVFGALLGVLAWCLLLTPIGLVFHGQTLTPERTAIFVFLAALLLPLGLVLEAVFRRGSLLRGALCSLAGRLLVIAALGSATAAGALPGVVFLMLPILGAVLLVLEVPGVFIRAAGGSVLAAATFQAGLLAWIFAAVLPVRL